MAYAGRVVLTMERSVERKIWWGVTSAYIILIYSTLGVAPLIWEKLALRALMSGGRIYWFYGLVFISLLICISVKRHSFRMKKYAVFFILMFIAFFLLKKTVFLAQKIHLVEYGLLGVFLYNLFRTYFDRFDSRLYMSAGITAFAAGCADESIQWVLPNRVFSPWDIMMNTVGAVISLLFIRYSLLSD